MTFRFLVLFCLVNLAIASPKDRVIKEDLSKEEHWKNTGDGENEHNLEYDHEAFLGKDGAKDFDGLSDEQGKSMLGLIFHKIDKDGNNLVDEQELYNWVKQTQFKYIWDDADKQMKQNDLNRDGYVEWDEYKNSTYGYLDQNNDEHAEQYREMIARDDRRYKRADKNADGKLSREEFGSFLHPESDDDMKSIVVDETLDDIDKDKDGFISLNEYIGDLWPEEDREGEEPEWVKTERVQFTDYRDKNKDSRMDKSEVADWILPPDYDHISSEVKHLVAEADENKDGKITKEEMLDKYNLFVGSQATDFGEALKIEPREDL